MPDPGEPEVYTSPPVRAAADAGAPVEPEHRLVAGLAHAAAVCGVARPGDAARIARRPALQHYLAGEAPTWWVVPLLAGSVVAPIALAGTAAAAVAALAAASAFLYVWRRASDRRRRLAVVLALAYEAFTVEAVSQRLTRNGLLTLARAYDYPRHDPMLPDGLESVISLTHGFPGHDDEPAELADADRVVATLLRRRGIDPDARWAVQRSWHGTPASLLETLSSLSAPSPASR